MFKTFLGLLPAVPAVVVPGLVVLAVTPFTPVPILLAAGFGAMTERLTGVDAAVWLVIYSIVFAVIQLTIDYFTVRLWTSRILPRRFRN